MTKINRTLHQDRLIRRFAKKHGKDARVIKEIINSPIKFANRVVSDPMDNRPIRVRYFGVIVLKHKDAKINMFKDRVKRLKNKVDETIIILTSMGYLIKDESSVHRILDEALENQEYDKIQAFWEEHRRIMKR